jgi:DNA-binding MarR family transcriptional regulator
VDVATDQDSERLLDEAIVLMPEVGKCLFASIMRHPSVEGSTVPQVKALWFLAQHAPCTVGELANGLGIAMATASEAVDRLVERSLIERKADPADRRRVMLTLTAQGQSMMDDLLAIRRRQMRMAFARLPAADRAAFVNALRVLIEVLAEDVGPGATPAWPTPN